MADAYGTMVLTYSENIECDFDGLVKYLNCFSWSSDDCGWEKGSCEDGSFWVGTTVYNPQYPTVFVEEYEIGDDEELTFIDISLADLASYISDYITTGYIEIACVSNEKHRYISFQRLKVDSEGNASRSNNTVGLGYDHVFEEECRGN